MAHMFIPKPVLGAVMSSSLDRIAELRQVTTLFICLDTYSPVLHQDPLTMQPFFSIVQLALHYSGGYLRQFIIDDKGCCIIAAWGVPQFSYYNNALRALWCAATIRKGALAINHSCSIGMTTGYGYCSDIGSSLRRDYVIVSHHVNMAARLMGKANSRILMDAATRLCLPERIQNSLKAVEQLMLKGSQDFVIPFVCDSDDIFSINILEDVKESTDLLRGYVKNVLGSHIDRINNFTKSATTKMISSRLGSMSRGESSNNLAVSPDKHKLSREVSVISRQGSTFHMNHQSSTRSIESSPKRLSFMNRFLPGTDQNDDITVGRNFSEQNLVPKENSHKSSCILLFGQPGKL
jgi:class 3 adenylate cyclase